VDYSSEVHGCTDASPALPPDLPDLWSDVHRLL
jgi:hypothetical protein